MAPTPTDHESDDDVVDLPHVDLDAEPPSSLTAEPVSTDHAGRDRTGASRRRRWLAFLAVFVAGGLLGVYIADVRADAEAANTVTARLGRLDVAPRAPGGFEPGEPVRVNVDILNTSDRDIVVTAVSVPGMLDDGDRAVLKPAEIAPGMWATVTIIEQVDCHARGLPPAAMLDVTSSGGRRYQVEAMGPQSTALALSRTLQVACSS
jgi:hypothetical protein